MELVIVSAILLSIMLFVNSVVFAEESQKIGTKEFLRVITRM